MRVGRELLSLIQGALVDRGCHTLLNPQERVLVSLGDIVNHCLALVLQVEGLVGLIVRGLCLDLVLAAVLRIDFERLSLILVPHASVAVGALSLREDGLLIAGGLIEH